MFRGPWGWTRHCRSVMSPVRLPGCLTVTDPRRSPDVRLAALSCLVDYVQADGDQEDLALLLTMLESDPVPLVRRRLTRMLVNAPPFQRGRRHKLDTGDTAIRLWMLMK